MRLGIFLLPLAISCSSTPDDVPDAPDGSPPVAVPDAGPSGADGSPPLGTDAAAGPTMAILSPAAGALWDQSPAVEVSFEGSADIVKVDLFTGPDEGNLMPVAGYGGASGSASLWVSPEVERALVIRVDGTTAEGATVSTTLALDYAFGSRLSEGSGLAGELGGVDSDAESYAVDESISFGGTLAAQAGDVLVGLTENSEGAVSYLQAPGEPWFVPAGGDFSIPAADARYTFNVAPPRGDDQVRFILLGQAPDALPDLAADVDLERATRMVVGNSARWDYADVLYEVK